MNVNPESADFGKVVPWDSLSDEEKQSGNWIELPDVSGEPKMARRDVYGRLARENKRLDGILSSYGTKPSSSGPREFDALGKTPMTSRPAAPREETETTHEGGKE